MTAPRIVYSKHHPAPKRKGRQPLPPTGGSGFGYLVAMTAVLALTLLLVSHLGMRAEAAGPQTLEQLIQQLDREERARHGIEPGEAVSEVDPREAEYGYLAPLVACRDAYGPGCWDRIAPKTK